MNAPQTIALRWCPICGRDDRFTKISDNHYSGGSKCLGTPVVVTYHHEREVNEWREEADNHLRKRQEAMAALDALEARS